MTLDVQDPSRGVAFYIRQLGFGAGITVCEGGGRFCLGVDGHQRIDVHMPSVPTNGNYLEEITFRTSDIDQMRRHLVANGFQPTAISDASTANRSFSLLDPDGHRVGFIQYLEADKFSHPETQTSSRLIHAGFIVRDREKMEHFYKDILGFRPYWHGGMKDDETNWVSLQVPDGTDWIEFMLNVPVDASKHLRGVMNHIALGVTDIQAAKAQLIKNGLKLTEEPKLGRDGKWQLNVYDPDETRIEFMEFTPKEKPCCSDFTGPHPKP